MLYIVKGGNVPVVASSLFHYKNGIAYEDWTRLKIDFNDPSSNGWELTIRSKEDKYFIYTGPEDVDPKLLLSDYFRITPVVISITADDSDDYTINSDFQLSDLETTIISGSGKENVNILISLKYELGVIRDPVPSGQNDEDLVNVPWGFYYVTLELWLNKQ